MFASVGKYESKQYPGFIPLWQEEIRPSPVIQEKQAVQEAPSFRQSSFTSWEEQKQQLEAYAKRLYPDVMSTKILLSKRAWLRPWVSPLPP